ncbi:ATP-binding protein [Micromonospora sp. NPDC048063]|uniref:ATP-binding protein n=1 Tax=Micromonospora sp. NPDC048063 TaxID=3364256 RepID=UPI00371A6F5A
MSAPDGGWADANRDHLLAELDVLRLAVRPDATPADHRQAEERLAEAGRRLGGPGTLDQVAVGFGLTPFERAVLLLAAGPELVSAVADELTTACGRPALTFGAALSRLPQPHWSALVPSAPLRAWGLLRLADPSSPTRSPLVVDERILHHLAGAGDLDADLARVARTVEARPELPGPWQAVVERLVDAWGRRRSVLLCGPQPANLRVVAAAAATRAGSRLLLVPAVDLPAEATERWRTLRLMARETVLTGCAWAVDLTDAGLPAGEDVARVLPGLGAPVVLLAGEETMLPDHDLVRVTLTRLDVADRRRVFAAALRRVGAPAEAAAEAAGVFDLSLADVDVAASDAARGTPLWQACRARVRPSFGVLTQLRQPRATWDDLVLPPTQLAQLRALTASVRFRTLVFDDWGFARRTARDLGTTALFVGPSGTGKSLAAEVVAGDLGLDLVTVDLSQVVSKYVGETEKNLRRLFAAAEDSAAVLLFDEADTLFGKRTEVRDSHDRYANLEVGYLLHRLESFRGLAVLTSNARSAIDHAFVRRLRTVVTFPYPDAGMREALWRAAFPTATPVADLDPADLARADLTGGGIAAVALSAAYLAAGEQSAITPAHVRLATRWELAKSGRSAVDG